MASFKRSHGHALNQRDIASKIFLRSTKGKCVKVVRELYLRSDIPCSSSLCTSCASSSPMDRKAYRNLFVLSANPGCTKKITNGHYLIPDTNIFMYCTDVIEHKSAFYDIIVLQTVLEELRNRSVPLYNRLRALANSVDKRVYVFHNEFRRETFVERLEGESINDRNDRAVRAACIWYKHHMMKAVEGTRYVCPNIVMLSDDRANLAKAAADGVESYSMKDYVEGLENSDELLDMMGTATEDGGVTLVNGDSIYPEYYTMSKLATGTKAGTLHQGMYNANMYNFLEGSVHTSSFDHPLLVLGRENINRAVHGDLVVAEILPKAEWKRPSNKIVEDDTIGRNNSIHIEEPGIIETKQEPKSFIEEARLTQSRTGKAGVQPTVRIVGIIKRNWRYYVGHLEPSSTSPSWCRGQRTVFVLPMDKRIPKIRIRTRQALELLGKRIVVSIDSWDHRSRYPVGHFVRSLGELETREAETEALLMEHNVQYRPFSDAVLSCLPKEGHKWRVPPSLSDPRWKGRVDFRNKLICSIDPPGCQDIDDALHAAKLVNGNYEVGVHIADVSHFVKPNTAMDDEATIRGTTVYLVDKRIDMLPMLLGTDLCSLKPGVDRFAFSTVWEITPGADIISVAFSKSVIKSRSAFSYEQAQLRIDDMTQQDALTQGMRSLLMLAKQLRRRRMDAGALNLASPEVKIETESETSDPVDIKTKKLLETNSLVEEFMLLANISVATKIYSAFPQTAILRRHVTPPATNFEELQRQLSIRKNITLRAESSRALAESLDVCVDSCEPFFNTLVRILATRCMSSAEYFYSGAHAYHEFRHYGLASTIYTHFTSPIRRYADIIAHRQLSAAIGFEPADVGLHSAAKLAAVCANINFRHRNAQFAGRASMDYYVGQALKAKVAEEEGWVTKVFSNGFVVYVPKFGIEGAIRVKDLFKGKMVVPETEFLTESYVLRIRNGIKIFEVALFDKVTVNIKDVNDENGGRGNIQLTLVPVAS